MPNEFDWINNLVPVDPEPVKKSFTKKTVSPLPVLVEELFLPYSNAAVFNSKVKNKFLTFDYFLKTGDKVGTMLIQELELGKSPVTTILAVAKTHLAKLKILLEGEDWEMGCLLISKKEVRQEGITLTTQYVYKLEAKEVPVNVINKESVKKPKKAVPSRLLLDSLEGMNDA